MERYLDSEYTYCDARVIAAYWNEDIAEAKQVIGSKLLADDVEGLDALFEEARGELDHGSLQELSCNYADEGYTYADMEALAEHWQRSVEDTKALVEQKLLWGDNEVVQSALEDSAVLQGHH